MKILCTGDIHGNLRIYEQIKHICNNEGIDLLLLAGDLLPKSQLFSYSNLKNLQENYMENINKILKDVSCPIFYIFGNDDLTDCSFSVGTKISGKIIDFNGISIMGFDYVNITPFNSNREKSEEDLYFLFNNVYKKYNNENPLIILSHCALMDSLDCTMSGENVGSPTLRNMIEWLQPTAYIHGHIHDDFGKDIIGKTNVFNCSCQHEIDMLNGFILTIEEGHILEVEKI